MPELPEVETIRAQLEKTTPLTIIKVNYSPVHRSILKEKSKHFDPVGVTISHMKRIGKLLVFSCDDDKYFLSHLGMSGSWRISKTKITEKHTHIQFETIGKNKKKVFIGYVDPRRFGNLYFYHEEMAKEFMNGLGIDIGSKEFTAEYVYSVFKKFPNKVLKPFLLDQKHFAGCGNYIASEICARAGIRPTRKTGKVTKKEATLIAEVTKLVLDQSIEANGMTFSGGYSDTSGEKGAGVQNLVVFYQKTCGLCKSTPVKKIVLQKRGTYYCPFCQK
jgi:formamidopyrimidine-DNA glycosylase